jgi:aerobic-type carbon monoxide dehydrogenase small subunit (CoxS/CutS family)
MEQTVKFKLNGEPQQLSVDPERKLLWILRSDVGLTGMKYGCGDGHCGACTVLLDGEPVRSCQIPVKAAEGKEVVTIEGLAKDGNLHPVQKAFADLDALQCGFCTPGMILEAVGLLHKTPRPRRRDIVRAMEHNYCRCGAHTRIVQAIETAAEAISGGKTS